MQLGTGLIKNTRNFQSFCKPKSEVKTYFCEIYQATWYFNKTLLIFEIRANRFLHGMVRAIVGTLVELGRGKITLGEMQDIIDSGDRTDIPLTAPAKGLVLEDIYYPELEFGK